MFLTARLFKRPLAVLLFVPHHLNNTFNARSCPAVKSQCEICPRAGVEETRRHSLSQTLEPLQQSGCALPPTAVPLLGAGLEVKPRLAARPRRACVFLNQHVVRIKR